MPGWGGHARLCDERKRASRTVFRSASSCRAGSATTDQECSRHRTYWTSRTRISGEGCYFDSRHTYANINPGETGVKFVPISRMVPRSFITNIKSGDACLRVGTPTLARGISFGAIRACRGSISQVTVARAGSKQTSADEGKYGFRQWQIPLRRARQRTAGAHGSAATNSNGESQPYTPIGIRAGSCATSSSNAVVVTEEERMFRRHWGRVHRSHALASLSVHAGEKLSLKSVISICPPEIACIDGPGADVLNSNCLPATPRAWCSTSRRCRRHNGTPRSTRCAPLTGADRSQGRRHHRRHLVGIRGAK